MIDVTCVDTLLPTIRWCKPVSRSTVGIGQPFGRKQLTALSTLLWMTKPRLGLLSQVCANQRHTRSQSADTCVAWENVTSVAQGTEECDKISQGGDTTVACSHVIIVTHNEINPSQLFVVFRRWWIEPHHPATHNNFLSRQTIVWFINRELLCITNPSKQQQTNPFSITFRSSACSKQVCG